MLLSGMVSTSRAQVLVFDLLLCSCMCSGAMSMTVTTFASTNNQSRSPSKDSEPRLNLTSYLASEESDCQPRIRGKHLITQTQLRKLGACFNITCPRHVRKTTSVALSTPTHDGLPLTKPSATWSYVLETDHHRFPKTLLRAVCRSRYKTPSSECRCMLENQRRELVLYRLKCTDGISRWVKSHIDVPYSCSCYQTQYCR